VDCREDWSLRVEQGVLVVRGESIHARHPLSCSEEVVRGCEGCRVVRLAPSQFLLPGLIDTHIHASQFPNAGLALDLTLLDWLERYTFPTEAGLACPEKARQVYSRCVQSTLSSGTTTACYFATIHTRSTQVLAEVCREAGQRALVGKVCMDRNCPDIYGEGSTGESLAEAMASVRAIRGLGSPLLTPIVTPRFVPTCSRELLTGLGELARREGLPVQTHLSENEREVAWVRALEPDCESYTQVYEKSGLLGPRTVLAHCVHLSDDEVEVIRSTGSGVSHCPNSNFSLKSGVCNVQRLRRAGVKVGLGTDCSGGFSPSVLDAMRQVKEPSPCQTNNPWLARRSQPPTSSTVTRWRRRRWCSATRCTWPPGAAPACWGGRGSWACWRPAPWPTSSWSTWTASRTPGCSGTRPRRTWCTRWFSWGTTGTSWRCLSPATG